MKSYTSINIATKRKEKKLDMTATTYRDIICVLAWSLDILCCIYLMVH